MRVPILQWKIALALLAVALVAVTLGSALARPANARRTTAHMAVPIGGWTAYTPIHSTAPLFHLGHPAKGAIFILGPARRTPLNRVLAWLYRTEVALNLVRS